MVKQPSEDTIRSLDKVAKLYDEIRELYLASDDDYFLYCLAMSLGAVTEAFAQERVKEFIQSDIVRSLNIEGIARQLK